MKHISTLSTFLSSLLLSQAVFATELPEALESSLQRAHATGDAFIINAVMDAAITSHPQLEEAIVKRSMELLKPAGGNAGTKTAQKAETEKQKTDVTWDGSVEGGLEYASGNSERENYLFKTEISRDSKNWLNEASFQARNSSEDDVRTNEDYRASGQGNYKLDDRRYVFGKLGYVNDRFSGFEYRVNESVGYGHKVIDKEDMKLKLEAGVGARHTKLLDSEGGDREDEFVLTPRGEFSWKIWDGVEFGQTVESAIGTSNVITESDTSLKTGLAENLFLKFSFNVEHISDVPADKENIDTQTAISFVYDF